MKIKTLKEYERDLAKCTYCGGTAVDTFDKTKPCPNCTADVEIIMTEEEKEEEINLKLNLEINQNYANT